MESINISGNGQHSKVSAELKEIVMEVSLYSDVPETCRKALYSFQFDRSYTKTPTTLDDLGSIAKTVIDQLPEHCSENSEDPDIRLLLSELQKVIEKNNLSGDDKIIALLGIIILANSARRPKEEMCRRVAWKAITILREIIQLPPLKLACGI